MKAAAVLSVLVLAGALAGSASGAAVRVTPFIKGAGTVYIVEGGGTVFTPICTNANTDDRVTKSDCVQTVRSNDLITTLTIAIRAVPLGSPANHWFFVPGWLPGTCHSLTAENYCTLQSPAFGTGDFAPLVIFDDVASPGLVTFVTESTSFIFERTITVSMVWNEPVDAQCRIDGGTPVACTADVTTFTLSEGTHTLDARAADKSGNLSGFSSQRTFKIVDTAITGGPSDGATTGPNVAFSYNTGAGVSFECSLDGGGYSACGGVPNGFTSYNGLSTGSHTFQVRAKDGEFFDHISATRTWTVDATPPDSSFASGPPSLTKSTAAQFVLSSNEGGSTFQCSLDGAAESACTSPANLTVGHGTHLFTVRATDQYGNVDATVASYSWSVDILAPNTRLTKSPGAKTGSRTATFKFNSTEANSTFKCKLDKKPWTTCRSPKMYKNLKKGKHTFQARATDKVGNTDASPVKKTWTIK